MRLSKITAAGNDFLVAGVCQPSQFRRETVTAMCDRHFGIGADGVLLSGNEHGKTRWWFFNADGSEAAFCGNGARALALFESALTGSREGQALTLAGAVSYLVAPDTRSVQLRFPRHWTSTFEAEKISQEIIRQWLPTDLLGPSIFINAGVPHACLPVAHFPRHHFSSTHAPADGWMTWARNVHEELKRRGCDLNLTVYESMNTSEVRAMTFERGIQGATLACGSGALSVAHTLAPQGTIRVHMPGGTLRIENTTSTTTLEGPAQHIARLEHTTWGIP